MLPIALLAGAVFQVLWPGDFGFRLENGGPERRSVVRGRRRRSSRSSPRSSRGGRSSSTATGWLPAIAVGLFVLPVAVHGFARWTTSTTVDADALTPGLVNALRDDVPKRGVVFSDMQTSYRIAAAAPVLIVAAPPEHVADTKQNRPYERRKDVMAFYSHAAISRSRAATTRAGSSSRASCRTRTSRCGRYTRTRALPSTGSDS